MTHHPMHIRLLVVALYDDDDRIAAQALVELRDLYGRDPETWPNALASKVLLTTLERPALADWASVLDPDTPTDRLLQLMRGQNRALADAAALAIDDRWQQGTLL